MSIRLNNLVHLSGEGSIGGMERGCGAAVSVEGRVKVTEELREQTGPGNPQPPQRESTVTVKNPQTRLNGHDRWLDPKSKELRGEGQGADTYH